MDETDDSRLIEAILASGVKIPPMPGMLLEVMKLDRDVDAGPRQFAALLARDPAISGAIFRVVGSPVLGLRTKVESLEKAVTVLGVRSTVGVARSEALRQALHDPKLEAVMQVLWRRMNAIADLLLATVRRARLRGIAEDLAFQAGIFHDCGVAVLCRRDPAYAAAFRAGAGWPDLIVLDRQRQTSHLVVGQMVARSWQLPADVALAVRHHHDVSIDKLPELAQRLVILIQFATHALALRTGAADDPAWEPVWRERTVAMFEAAGADLGDIERQLQG